MGGWGYYRLMMGEEANPGRATPGVCHKQGANMHKKTYHVGPSSHTPGLTPAKWPRLIVCAGIYKQEVPVEMVSELLLK